MGVTEDLADELAKEALAAIDRLGNDKLVDEVATILGASSQTLQEAFLTSVRVRRAERRARDYLAGLAQKPAAPQPKT